MASFVGTTGLYQNGLSNMLHFLYRIAPYLLNGLQSLFKVFPSSSHHSPSSSGISPTGCHTRFSSAPAMRPTQVAPQVTQLRSASLYWFTQNTKGPCTCMRS